LVLGIICIGNLRGQEPEEASIYSQFDMTIGPINSGVYAGFAYKEQFRVLGPKHKFFYSPDFLLGSVTYDGQVYFGYKMKYDVYGDQLLVFHPGINSSQAVQLIKERVTNFEIESHRFVNLPEQTDKESLPVSGFMEMLVEGDHFTFFKKHRKRILKKSDRKLLYHEFKDRSSYYISLEGELTQVKSLTHIATLFPEYRKQINDFTTTYQDIRKSNPEYYLISILSDLDEIIVAKKGKDL
jgi:hypothetical protein